MDSARIVFRPLPNCRSCCTGCSLGGRAGGGGIDHNFDRRHVRIRDAAWQDGAPVVRRVDARHGKPTERLTVTAF